MKELKERALGRRASALRASVHTWHPHCCLSEGSLSAPAIAKQRPERKAMPVCPRGTVLPLPAGPAS